MVKYQLIAWIYVWIVRYRNAYPSTLKISMLASTSRWATASSAPPSRLPRDLSKQHIPAADENNTIRL